MFLMMSQKPVKRIYFEILGFVAKATYETDFWNKVKHFWDKLILSSWIDRKVLPLFFGWNVMLIDKIKKIKDKKLLFYPFVLLFVITITLAFIPHHSCACGDEGNNKVRNGSKLTQVLIFAVEEVAYVIRKFTFPRN